MSTEIEPYTDPKPLDDEDEEYAEYDDDDLYDDD